ncbi:hypothetical protein OESDEN_10503 [Oesophagostomum dentatum]|uniref:Uncharacterized protein n=1 Tax=Oesophagostomum dentatum TaxID=61180 RepID=A0A0B1T2T1_OESDE|nr:hypothetical protein OESDEN_10503 [Oesophagostomum dentatum]
MRMSLRDVMCHPWVVGTLEAHVHHQSSANPANPPVTTARPTATA